MSEATENLKNNQRQLDEEGVFVGVSRQALVETLDEIAMLKDTNKHLRDTVATYHCNNLKDALLMAEIDPAYKEALRPHFEELARIFEVAK